LEDKIYKNLSIGFLIFALLKNKEDRQDNLRKQLKTMRSREQLIRVIRRSQTYASIILFVSVFLVCWKFANLDITEIQLSYWGKSGWIANLWNSAVCLFSVSIFVNSYLYLKNNARIKSRNAFYWLFGMVATALFLVGVFNMDNRLIHNVSAGVYFLLYPLSIFLFSYFNRIFMTYVDWLQTMVISASMTILPIAMLQLFHGMAIAEVAHALLVILYNIKISRHE